MFIIILMPLLVSENRRKDAYFQYITQIHCVGIAGMQKIEYKITLNFPKKPTNKEQ